MFRCLGVQVFRCSGVIDIFEGQKGDQGDCPKMTKIQYGKPDIFKRAAETLPNQPPSTKPSLHHHGCFAQCNNVTLGSYIGQTASCTAFSCGGQVPDVAVPHYRDARMQHSGASRSGRVSPHGFGTMVTCASRRQALTLHRPPISSPTTTNWHLPPFNSSWYLFSLSTRALSRTAPFTVEALGQAAPNDVTADLRVMSTANCAPWCIGRPNTRTSIDRSSTTGTDQF